jgi:hypothetical protein
MAVLLRSPQPGVTSREGAFASTCDDDGAGGNVSEQAEWRRRSSPVLTLNQPGALAVGAPRNAVGIQAPAGASSTPSTPSTRGGQLPAAGAVTLATGSPSTDPSVGTRR